MDPFSTTANAIAVIGITCKTCQSLYYFFSEISDAPKDVRQHFQALQSLGSVLSNIQVLFAHSEVQPHVSVEFKACLRECIADVHTVETKVCKVNSSFQKGRLHRTWARLKWSSSTDHWLGKFFDRIQTYHTIFSLELITIQV